MMRLLTLRRIESSTSLKEEVSSEGVSAASGEAEVREAEVRCERGDGW